MENLKKWLDITNTKHKDLAKKLKISDPAFHGKIKRGIKYYNGLQDISILTGLSIDQLNDREVFYKTFEIPKEENTESILKNLHANLEARKFIRPIFCYVDFSRVYLVLNTRETFLKHKFNYELALLEQESIMNTIKSYLKMQNVTLFEEKYLGYPEVKYYV